MSQPEFTPVNQNYYTPANTFNQLSENYKLLDLYSGISAPFADPSVWLDGSGRAQLQGAVKINTSSVIPQMPLVQLPTGLIPTKDCMFPVAVERAGAYVANALYLSSFGSDIASISITAPGSYTAIPTVSLTGPGKNAVLGSTTMAGLSSSVVATPQSSTGSYAPGNTITATGGTFSTAAKYNVVTTGVISATIVSGGTGGASDGTFTVTGTTGTGTKFTALASFTSGIITAISSISSAGSYTVNPTTLTSEPVTGNDVVGAVFSVKMGVETISPNTGGSYTALPSNPVSTTSNGAGTGCTLTMAYGVSSIPVVSGGEDYTPASGVSFSAGAAAAHINLGSSTVGLFSLVTQPEQNDIVHLDPAIFYLNSYNV
jgi:hypothetical protein